MEIDNHPLNCKFHCLDMASDKSEEMKKLVQKEKELHKEIHDDFEKISQKINDDFEKIKQSKSTQ